MKGWNKLLILVFGLCLLGGIWINLYLFHIQNEPTPKLQYVQINRMIQALEQGATIKEVITDDITVRFLNKEQLSLQTYLNQGNYQMLILPAKQTDTFYEFTYKASSIPQQLILMINVFFLFLLLFVGGIAWYLYTQILQPFHQMKHMVTALKNRDFSYTLPQTKRGYFKDFLWAIDVMKDELAHHEQQELKLMKEKKTMIASLTHDIKTPLSNIRLYTDAQKEKLYPEEVIRHRIYENCDKIDQYVKEIMNTAKEELFDFTIELKEVYMSEICEILQHEQERIALALVAYVQDTYEDCLVYTDLNRLREVINNVIDNALKYGDGGWIHISFYVEDGHQIIKLENSGKGIAQVDANQIFQSFYRGQQETSLTGNGLGLYICKVLMRAMEGDIFMSQAEGSVAFHIVLGNL